MAAVLWSIVSKICLKQYTLPRYVNRSTNFSGSPLRLGVALSHLKHISSVLFAFALRLMFPTASSSLCNRDSAWAGGVCEKR